MTPCTTSEGTGVSSRGCTWPSPASQRGRIPSRAIAYGTRAAVSTMPLFAPSVEMRMVAATRAAPFAPRVTSAALAATRGDSAIRAGDKT